MSKGSCLSDFMLHGVDVSGKISRGPKELLTWMQIPCILNKAVPKRMNTQGETNIYRDIILSSLNFQNY